MELEHRIMKNMMRIAANARRKHNGVTREHPHSCYGYGHILDLLSEHDGLTQQEISEAIGIRPQSASEAIVNMKKQGLISKQTNEQDRRSSLVFITDKGKARQAELMHERQQNAKRIFAPLSEEEKTVLLNLLDKVSAAQQESKEET